MIHEQYIGAIASPCNDSGQFGKVSTEGTTRISQSIIERKENGSEREAKVHVLGKFVEQWVSSPKGVSGA